MQYTLLNGRTTNGNGDAVQIPGVRGEHISTRLIDVWGVLDGAVVTVEHSHDGGTRWSPATGISWSAATLGVKAIYLAPNQLVRLVVTGGAESTQSVFGRLI